MLQLHPHKMSFRILLSTVLMCLTFYANAQKPSEDSKERIKALKVAYITENLDLTPEEAVKFWPIYNAYEERVHHLKYVELRPIRAQFRDNAISEAKARELLDKAIDIDDKIHRERQQLIRNLRKEISAKKVMMLKKTEDDFYHQLYKQLRDKKIKKLMKQKLCYAFITCRNCFRFTYK